MLALLLIPLAMAVLAFCGAVAFGWLLGALGAWAGRRYLGWPD